MNSEGIPRRPAKQHATGNVHNHVTVHSTNFRRCRAARIFSGSVRNGRYEAFARKTCSSATNYCSADVDAQESRSEMRHPGVLLAKTRRKQGRVRLESFCGPDSHSELARPETRPRVLQAACAVARFRSRKASRTPNPVYENSL